MIKGKTSSGFEFEIDENKIIKFKYLQIVRKIDKGELQYVVDLAEYLLEDKLDELIESLGGNPTYLEINSALMEIINKSSDLKNL